MFMTIFSDEPSMGIGDNDEVILIKNAENEEQALEKAKQYLNENDRDYNCSCVFNLNNCKTLD